MEFAEFLMNMKSLNDAKKKKEKKKGQKDSFFKYSADSIRKKREKKQVKR